MKSYLIPTMWFLFVCVEFFVPLENFSLIWRRHHYRWRAANFWPEQSGKIAIPKIWMRSTWSDSFRVTIGVKQVCTMSWFLCLLVTDNTVEGTIEIKPTGIRIALNQIKSADLNSAGDYHCYPLINKNLAWHSRVTW